MRGQSSGRWPGYVMSTKVIFGQAEVRLPRRPQAVLPRSQIFSEKRKWRHKWKADENLYSSCLFKRQYTGV